MKKTISVFFSGTSFRISDTAYVAAFLFSITEESEHQIKMGFDGCGVDSVISGRIFGSGLDKQCDEVIQRIVQEIAAGNEITLNVYGYGRGGIGALMLAKQLSSVDPKILSINLALLDPVPENSITTSTIDPLKISLANKTMDLTDCKPLKKVLALYPYGPLPSLTFYAPLFVSYPEDVALEEDIIDGCHVNAESLCRFPSKITYLRVGEFLFKNGTKFNSSEEFSNNEKLKEAYINEYEQQLTIINRAGQSFTRDTHSATGVYIKAKTGAQYLNEHHKRLAGGTNDAAVALTIEQSRGLISVLKRAIKAHPVAWHILKWSVLAIAITCLLYFTGGLGAIPIIAGTVTKLGVMTILAATPIVGISLSAWWYGVIKPTALWAANLFYYPRFSIRDIAVASPELKEGSTPKLFQMLCGSNSPAGSVSNESQLQNAPYHGKKLLNTSEFTNQPSSLSTDDTMGL